MQDRIYSPFLFPSQAGIQMQTPSLYLHIVLGNNVFCWGGCGAERSSLMNEFEKIQRSL